eukprot:jgi/Mesen1/1625/ME000135S00625
MPGLSFGPKLEPVEGLLRADVERFKLACSVCRQPRGACIQCHGDRCTTSYHPMCALKSGYVMEVRRTRS